MPLEERVKAEPCAGSLSACLVDGNAEQSARERKVKRRALAISVSLQTIGLTALVIAPLLAKPAELGMPTVPPMPIYSSRPSHPHAITEVRRPVSGPCFTCAMNSRPQILHAQPNSDDGRNRGNDGGEVFIPGIPSNEGIPLLDSWRQPERPAVPEVQPRVMHVTHIDPALLTHRVEPVYPALARQIHRAGKVELHALIGTDGTIQSLQLVSGDPLFVQSALDAVKQWRYQPTKLNGLAVEVDTYITVVYTLHQ